MIVPPITEGHAKTVRSSVIVSAIGKFDNWDKRECAVDEANVAYWRTEVADYLARSPPRVPKHIHQIWIGTREPPCVWLDTWRVSFMADASKEWGYTLWDNCKAADFQDMINRDLFDEEKMWQCKADIMRLEILYKYGGVYIDADMVSLNKPLDAILNSCKDTGFLIGYEPDTKDKPYSVLGNSFIVASKGHPLLRLLIGYISAIYHHKRPHHTVEWVTGPLACTKALVHTGMPMTVPPTELLYPQFHYVPNPSAIDFSLFPNALAFQFGYTCSGLGRWIEENNRCRRALDCPYHSKKTDYALGAMLPFPKSTPGSSRDAPVPNIIHQFQFNSTNPPARWIASWADGFIGANPGWVHKLWTYDSLKALGGFFCTNMYPPVGRQMDTDTITLLALEVLFKQGGYYIPLSTLYTGAGRAHEESGFPPNTTGDLVAYDSIISCPPGSTGALAAIKACYDTGKQGLPLLSSIGLSDITQQGHSDSITAYASFPEGSRFLGASELFFSTRTDSAKGAAGAEISSIIFGYDCQVPCTCISSSNLALVRACTRQAVFIFDAQMSLYPNMLDAIAGFIHKATQVNESWDYILVGMEWSAGVDEEILYKAVGPFRDQKVSYLAVIVSPGNATGLLETYEKSSAIAEDILGKFDSREVVVGVVRFADTEEVSSIYRAMPVVRSTFAQICNHEIPSWNRDETEVHGRLLKGLVGGQVSYEISVDDEKRIMYRAFNPDGGLNCEIKIITGPAGRHLVDYARVFYDHAVVFEGSQISV